MSASTRNIIAWILQVLLALASVFSGYNKLAHISTIIQQFGNIGLPAWFAYFIGGAEVLGGIGLLLPRTVRLAALGLLIILAGALVMHATRIPGGISHGAPAAIGLVLTALLLWLRRPAPSSAPTRGQKEALGAH